MNTKCSAIILMAGKGERFGSTLPKQFHRLSGKPVFIHTVETMLVSNLFHEIILVYPKNWLAKIKLELSTITTSIPIHFVQGGDTRKNSSYLGIQAVDKKTTHVLIHDAVRPFVSQRILVENVSYAIQHGAVDTCIPSADTVVNIDEQLYISQIPNRNLCMRGQTPQTFSLPLIKEAHEVFFKDENLPVTDDCSLITLLGKKVKVVQGEEKNIKITTELDLFLAEQLLRIPDLSYPSSSPNFQDKTFVITGGTGAIGTHVQKKLIQHGAKVISISRNSKNYQADLSDSRQAKKIFEKIYLDCGPVDGLINSIGQLIYKPFQSLKDEEVHELIASNLASILFSCKYARIKNKGHILNIASSSYFRGRKGYAVYSATKAAIVNFTQGLAEELPTLFVNALTPQRISSPLRMKNFPKEPKEDLLTLEEIAEAITNILSQNLNTGAIIDIRKNF